MKRKKELYEDPAHKKAKSFYLRIALVILLCVAVYRVSQYVLRDRTPDSRRPHVSRSRPVTLGWELLKIDTLGGCSYYEKLGSTVFFRDGSGTFRVQGQIVFSSELKTLHELLEARAARYLLEINCRNRKFLFCPLELVGADHVFKYPPCTSPSAWMEPEPKSGVYEICCAICRIKP